MQTGQQLNKGKILRRVCARRRVLAGIVFFAISALFVLFHLAATGRIELDRVLDPCGFKQRHGLPCPTCGMTTSVLAFARGRVFESFYTQPVAALTCCMMLIGAFLALLTAVLGIYFRLLDSLFSQMTVKYVVVSLIIIIAAGWAVTLARALAANARA